MKAGVAICSQESREYLASEGLTDDWQNWLDVVNCATMPEDILDHGVYMCPVADGAYSHQRGEYFGMYSGDKRVTHVARIQGVVDVIDPVTTTVKWIGRGEDKKALVAKAADKVAAVRKQYPTRVFVLDTLHETEFIKESKGGLQGTKQYFNVRKLSPQDAADLATQLRGKSWGWLQAYL